MSKRRRKSDRKNRMVSEQREYLHIPTPVKIKRADPYIVRQVEDLRRYDPEVKMPRGLFSRSTDIVVNENVNNNKRSKEVPRKVHFSVPDEVAVCVRRKQRRQVMFALGRTGKGSRSPRRRNRFSDWEC